MKVTLCILTVALIVVWSVAFAVSAAAPLPSAELQTCETVPMEEDENKEIVVESEKEEAAIGTPCAEAELIVEEKVVFAAEENEEKETLRSVTSPSEQWRKQDPHWRDYGSPIKGY